jgi:hypothetical protein
MSAGAQHSVPPSTLQRSATTTRIPLRPNVQPPHAPALRATQAQRTQPTQQQYTVTENPEGRPPVAHNKTPCVIRVHTCTGIQHGSLKHELTYKRGDNDQIIANNEYSSEFRAKYFLYRNARYAALTGGHMKDFGWYELLKTMWPE